MDYKNEYKSKLKTAEEAALLVKSGDWIDFSVGTIFPTLCDEAISKRRDELFDVKVRGNLLYGPTKTAECDPTHEHFVYSSWHTSGYERGLCDKGLCFYEPMLFRNLFWYYKEFLDVDVAFACATPMNEEGYFNFSVASGNAGAPLQKAKKIVIEVNENLVPCVGVGCGLIHISEVTAVVEGPHDKMVQLPMREPSDLEKQIAKHIIPHVVDGATIQLGIGGVPDAVGSMIAEAGIKDLGMHTEFCTDAFYNLYEAGVLTNKRKTKDQNLGVYGIAAGTDRLYNWLKDNKEVVSMPMHYVNDPYVIKSLDNFVSLNSCIAADLYGQVSSESAGLRHISGTGGQVDFLTGAAMSRGGKAFICMTSSFVDKKGVKQSRIVPHFNGDIITSPRSQAYYIATEQGVVNLAGRSTWERAEMLISVADPDFRDELIKAAESQKIWRKSNKK